MGRKEFDSVLNFVLLVEEEGESAKKDSLVGAFYVTMLPGSFR